MFSLMIQMTGRPQVSRTDLLDVTFLSTVNKDVYQVSEPGDVVRVQPQVRNSEIDFGSIDLKKRNTT